jgi:GAF domain-containing protein
MASDPKGIVDTLHRLARLDPVELGLAAVLDQIVQAATSCCGISGGVGLLLLGPDDQLHYVAAADHRRSMLAGIQLPERDGPSVDAFVQDQPVSSVDLAAERRWPAFRQQATAAGLRAWLSVPVRQRHGPIGTLDLARHRPPALAAPGGGHRRRLCSADYGHPGPGQRPPAAGAWPGAGVCRPA